MNKEQVRFNMIEQQIRPWDVLDPDVLGLYSRVPREKFVPPGSADLAFADSIIPIGHGETMMCPKVEARLLQALSIKTSERILEIGTGPGFLTALLATMGSHVTSIEYHKDLHLAARKNLTECSIENVELIHGDGIDGWSHSAPYDLIVITGSSPKRKIPLEEQLAVGGRLFIVVGLSPVMTATLISKVAENAWAEETLFETDLKPLIGADQKPEFNF